MPFHGFTAIAVAACAIVLGAQQQNQPIAPTSPAGSGGLETGRGRGAAAPQGPTPHFPNGTVDLSGVWQGGGPVGDLAQGLKAGDTIPLNEEGKKVEFTVKKGDRVLISKYGGTEIKVDGESYLIMREDDILGIIG